MACNSCNKPKETCKCPTKVSTDCVNYDSDGLIPLGVIPGDNLTDVIKTINNIFADVLLKIDGDAKNLGEGSKVYKGKNSEGVIEYRTLTGGTGIVLTQTATEIKIAADEEWLQEYLREYLNEQWFDQHFRNIIKQPWFADYLQTLFLQDWFGDILTHWIKKEWFLLYLQSLIKQPWFKSVLELHLSQPWFEALLKTIFYKPWFSKLLAELLEQSWFVDLVRDLVSKVSGVDIYHSGVGSALFTKVSDNEYKFKGIESADGSIVIRDNGESIDLSVVLPEKVSLSSTDGSVTITEVGNGFNLSVPKPVTRAVSGVGSDGSVSLVHNADADKIEISKLKSNSLKITKQPSGEVTIETADFNYIKEFHVNSKYVPTPDSPSDGSIIRPYRTFDEAKAAFIGTGSVTQPQYGGNVIVLHTGSHTTENPTVNNLRIRLEDGAGLRYDGNDEYMFDSELPSLDLKNSDGSYKASFVMGLEGNGTFSRTTPGGVIRVIEKKSPNETQIFPNDHRFHSYIRIGRAGEGDEVTIHSVPGVQGPPDGEHQTPQGHKYGDNYNPIQKLYWKRDVKGTTPLIYVENSGFGSFQHPLFVYGTVSLWGDFKNSVIHAKNTLVAGNYSKVKVNHGFIYDGLINPVKDGTYYENGYTNNYKPVEGSSLIVIENATLHSVEIHNVNDGTFTHIGYENFFKLIGNVKSMPILSYHLGYFAENFIDATEITGNYLYFNSWSTSGYKKDAYGFYFVKASKPLNLYMRNFDVTGSLQLSNQPVTVHTGGTLTTISNVPYLSGFDNLNGSKSTARTESASLAGASGIGRPMIVNNGV